MSGTRISGLWMWIILVFIVGCSCLFATELASADGPPVKWEKALGGSSYDKGYSVQQTADGGYIIAGETSSFGAGYNDVYLIKTDPNGNTQWQKTFGGSATDGAYSVQQTSDGGYIITGWTMSFGAGGHDVYLIKTDPNGNSQWQKTFGGVNTDNGYSIQQTSDDGYIIAGDTGSYSAAFFFDVYLIKTDPNGNLQWEKTFGGSDWEEGYSVQQTADGGYIIAGGTESFGDPVGDVYLVKTDPNGHSQWQKTFGGSSFDRSRSVRQTADGGYIIAGVTESFGAGWRDVYLIKADPNGNSQWEKTFGGSDWEEGYSVQQTSDGGYIIAGETYSFGAGQNDVYLIKTDPNGNSQWQQTLGGISLEGGRSVEQTMDGGYIIAGRTYSFGSGMYDVYLIKLCSDGTLAGDLNCDGIVNYEDVEILVSQWLQPRSILYPPADIFGVGDGITNFKDFALMASQWLTTDPCVPDDMVYIPDGEFDMGDHFAEGSSSELPLHAVLLDAFFMGKYEVTNAQYCSYLNSAFSTGIYFSGGRVYGTGNNQPYCDTHSYDTDSQIDYSGGVFSVRTKVGRDMSDDPMSEVSWYGAAAYCNWRSSEESKESCYNLSTWECDFSKHGYRLPTEAEWEYAARGGEHSPYYRFPWGDTIRHRQANYSASPGSYTYDVSPTSGRHPLWDGVYPDTSPVGFFDGTMKYKVDYNWPGSYTSYQTTNGANGYGLYDMAGNVWEWCNDWYDSNYYDASPYDNPEGPASGTVRVLRGGCWYYYAYDSRVALRNLTYPGYRNYDHGFRIVLDLN